MPEPRRPYYLGNLGHLSCPRPHEACLASQAGLPANRLAQRPADDPAERPNGSRRSGPPLPVLFLLLVFLHLSAGCADVVYNAPPAPPSLPDLVAISYTAADALDQTLVTYDIKDMPMLVSSFVNRDDLEETSPLGRTLSEQMGSRLAQHGYPVVDVRLRSATLLVRNEREAGLGEFALSRQVGALNHQYGAHSILVGTYAVVQRYVYVSARVLRCTDGVILAASDFSLPFQPGLLSPKDGRTPMIAPSVRTIF